jgi:ferredoxin
VIKKIAIIGTGPSSWSVFHALSAQPNSYELTIIDAGKRFASSSTNDFKSGQKGKFGSSHMYDTVGSTLSFSGQSNFSLAHGGLSTVWGAGIRLWPEDSISCLGVEVDEFYDEAKELLTRMEYSGDGETLNFPENYLVESKSLPPGSYLASLISLKKSRDTVKVFPTPLAVSTEGSNGCRGCGQCLSGCPYGSIFDSGIEFDRRYSDKEYEYLTGVVETVTEVSESVAVSLIKTNGEHATIHFDDVYLCAGAIGTPAILMQSGFLRQCVEVADSQVFYFMGLKTPHIVKEKQFALSQATLDSQVDSDNPFSASLYVCNKEVRERISNLIATKMYGLRVVVPSFVDRFLFLGIGFLDSKNSGKISLNRNDENKISVSTDLNPRSRMLVRQALKIIARFLRKNRLLVFSRMVILPKPGEGFHSGASLTLGGEYVDETGLLRGTKRIHVSDVSLLPFIKPGAHTFTSMALNAALIKRGSK